MIEEYGTCSSDEEKQGEPGIILGYWDQEQTFTLIQDLEHTVSSIETKCQNLLQQLICFKKYLDDLETPDHQNCLFELQAVETKKGKPKSIPTGSTPDVSLRKGQIEIQEAEKIFQENFEKKLQSIHQSLSNAVQKIGLKKSVFLFPTDEYLQMLNTSAVNQMPETLSNLPNILLGLKSPQTKAWSDTALRDISPAALGFSKITANDLRVYKKLSKLGAKKRSKRHSKTFDIRKSKLGADGRKMYLKVNTGLKTQMVETVRSKKEVRLEEITLKKTKKSKAKKRKMLSGKTDDPVKGVEDVDIRTLCDSLAKMVTDSSRYKTFCSSKPLEFTSQSYSLKRSHSVTSVMSKQNKDSLNRSNFAKDAARSGTQLKHRHEEESSCKKSRSRYTKSSPERLLGFRRITTKRYLNAQECYDESRTREAYAVGSNIMVSDCQRTNYIEMNEGNFFESGDSSLDERCELFKSMWAEVHTAFLKSYSKYSGLKEQFQKDEWVPSEVELESVENEINDAIEKYKDFWQLFCKSFVVNQRMDSLEIACKAPVVGQQFYKPTHSMLTREALRNVQDLQEKIKNISDL